MANLVFDFLHHYQTGERRASDPADAYQYDEGHVMEAVVPVAVTSCEIHYWVRGQEEAEAYVPESITQNEDGSYSIVGHIPNTYFETYGELRVYIVVTDGTASITTYEGRIHICERSKPDDYVDDDPENEATRVLNEAREAAATATAAAETCEEVLESIPEDYSQLSDDVSDLKDGFHDVVGAKPSWQSKNYVANNSAITNISVSADGTSIAFDIGSSANNIGVYSTTMFYSGKTYVIAFDISASVSDRVTLSTKYGIVDFVDSAHCFFVYTPSTNSSNTIYTSGANPLCRISITNFRVYEFTNQAEPSLMPTVVNIKNHVGQMDESIAKVDSLTEGIPYVYPENWLNMSNISLNTVISSSGATSSGSGVFTTDYFIPVENGDVITLTQLRTNGLFYHSAINMFRIGLYDAQKAPIGASPNYVNDYTISNANCKFIKVCLADAYNGGVTVLAEISINCIPTKASMTEHVAPHYDSFGVSDSIKRSRRVLWLGTSIPTYGYPQILARTCGCTMYNEAIGSSAIAKGITSNVTAANVCGIASIYGLYGLTQTVAEKQTMINNWSTIASEIGSTATLTDEIKNIALASSYETIVDPYLTGDDAVDLIVINHAYNDNTENAIAPENDKLNPHYLEGAYNWLIKRILEANPNIGVVIFGHYSDLPTSKETALQNVADRWNIPYYLLKNDLEWSSTQTITTTKKINSNGEWETISATDMTVQAMWLGDGVHPLGVASKRIAQVAQNVFADWLKSYC